MKIAEFGKRFPDEESCRAHFKKLRIKKGVTCKRCGGINHYWLASKSMFQCKDCRFRTSLKSGTVMENSKLPFRYWYIAMFLLTATKKSFSALEMQRQIGHKRYEPIWAMMHKIRMIMGQQEAMAELKGWIELDEGYFAFRVDKETRARFNGGKGSPRMATVLVMAESEEVESPKKNQKKRRCKKFRMKVIPDFKGTTVNREVTAVIHPDSHVMTDRIGSYSRLKDYFTEHIILPASGKRASELLPWVHTTISNAKRTLLGIFHGIGKGYVQNYLDEFCYKLNRRYRGEGRFYDLMEDSLTHWNHQKLVVK